MNDFFRNKLLENLIVLIEERAKELLNDNYTYVEGIIFLLISFVVEMGSLILFGYITYPLRVFDLLYNVITISITLPVSFFFAVFAGAFVAAIVRESAREALKVARFVVPIFGMFYALLLTVVLFWYQVLMTQDNVIVDALVLVALGLCYIGSYIVARELSTLVPRKISILRILVIFTGFIVIFTLLAGFLPWVGNLGFLITAGWLIAMLASVVIEFLIYWEKKKKIPPMEEQEQTINR